jgi:hypothetical protein
MLILTKVVSLPIFDNFAVDFATAKDGRQDSVFSDETRERLMGSSRDEAEAVKH